MSDSTSQTLPMDEREDDEISLLDLLIVLAKRKKMILGMTAGVALIAAALSLAMPNIYTGATKILPPQQGQSNAVAILGQLGAVGGMAGGSLGIKNPNDLYVAMLKSRTVADKIIQRFDLKNVYDKKFVADVRKNLEKASTISSGKDGVITVEVDDEDPKRATAMANAYVEELEKLTLDMAVTEASRRRLFFEKQLAQAKDNLTMAEQELKKFREATGLIQPENQAGLTVSASAALRAQITAKEVQLSAMRTFGTDQNPDIIRAQQEVLGLRTQLAKMEKNANQDKGDVLVAIGKAPEASLEFIRKTRDVKYYEILFEILAKQYESAKIDEAKNATLIQVLDKAVEPEKKSKPKRSQIVILSALAAAFVAILWAFLKEAGERAKSNPEQAERLRKLRHYLLGRA